MKALAGMIMITMMTMAGCTTGGDIDKQTAEVVAGKVIAIGMTIQEVVSLLGDPDSTTATMRSTEKKPGITGMRYGESMIIVKGGRVVEVVK